MVYSTDNITLYRYWLYYTILIKSNYTDTDYTILKSHYTDTDYTLLIISPYTDADYTILYR